MANFAGAATIMSIPSHRQLVLVMHPEPIVAMGVTSALADMPALDVQTFGGAERLNSPVVVICDEPGARTVIGSMPGAAVVVMVQKPREFEIQRALENGVLGYVVTSCRVEELEEAVRAASQGRRFLCRASAQEIANKFTSEPLTVRERDVLALLSLGNCNKAIAINLDIALGTVKAHVRAIMSKLDAGSRTEAASIAAARGLVCNALSVRERRVEFSRGVRQQTASSAVPL